MTADPKQIEAVRNGAPACPKCGLEAKTLLHRFCQHAICPVREALAKPPARELVGPDASGSYTYGDWTISYDPPPIPLRSMDWEFTHRDYDASYEGEEDGWVSNGLSGRCGSLMECLEEITEIEIEKGLV